MNSRRKPSSRSSGSSASARRSPANRRGSSPAPNTGRNHGKVPRSLIGNETDSRKGRGVTEPQRQAPTVKPASPRHPGSPGKKPTKPGSVQRPHVPVAMAWGALSALGMALLVAVPVFVAWAVDSKSSTSWNAALGVAIDIWALAHRAHIHADGTNIVLPPLALTFMCVLGARFGARLALPKQRLSSNDLRAILLGFMGGYILAAQFLGVVSSLGPSTINPITLILGPALVAGLGVAWAAWHERRNSPEIAAFDEAVVNATPLLAQRSIRSAMRGMRLLALLMFVFLVVLVAWHGQRIWSVHSQLHAGPVGGVLLVLGQLLVLPNLLALLAGWSVGAPAHFGDVIVGHSGMATGTLPMVPVLGAVPQGNIHPWSWLLAVTPVVVGGYIGWDAVGTLTRLSSLRAKLVVATCAAGLGTVLLWVVWWFSTASISTGVLSYVGPGWTAWVFAPFVFVIPAIVVASVRHWVLNHRPR